MANPINVQLSTAQRPAEASACAAIALGGNLGDSQRILLDAIASIATIPAVSAILAQSHLYKTAPVGPPQPDYINACITIQTTLPPRQLLHQLLAIENQFGRVRKERWGARSLDLDLIFYSDRIIQSLGLTVPHPRLQERPFVLIPLMDVAPNWQHPVLYKTVAQLTEQLAQQNLLTGVHRLPAYQSQTV